LRPLSTGKAPFGESGYSGLCVEVRRIPFTEAKD
jgi:hypothetical protein